MTIPPPMVPARAPAVVSRPAAATAANATARTTLTTVHGIQRFTPVYSGFRIRSTNRTGPALIVGCITSQVKNTPIHWLWYVILLHKFILCRRRFALREAGP